MKYIKLFVDNCIIYKEIEQANDFDVLQADLGKILN